VAEAIASLAVFGAVAAVPLVVIARLGPIRAG
jgi:hypothetical protein